MLPHNRVQNYFHKSGISLQVIYDGNEWSLAPKNESLPGDRCSIDPMTPRAYE